MSIIVTDIELYPSSEGFSPKACYHRGMDFLIYLNEDCSYRADRVDQFLTILWHPHEDRVVGIELKGFLSLFRAANLILGSSSEQPMPLAKLLSFLELRLNLFVEDGLLEKLEIERLRERYQKAIELSEKEQVLAEPVPV
jgi:hypothetical protein